MKSSKWTYKHLFEAGKALNSFQYLKEKGASFSPFNTPKFPVGIETTNIHPSLLKKWIFLRVTLVTMGR